MELIPSTEDRSAAPEEAAALTASVCLPLWAHLFKSSNLVITSTLHICGLSHFSPPDPPAYRPATISPVLLYFCFYSKPFFSVFSFMHPFTESLLSLPTDHCLVRLLVLFLTKVVPGLRQSREQNLMRSAFSLHKLSYRGDFMWYV